MAYRFTNIDPDGSIGLGKTVVTRLSTAGRRYRGIFIRFNRSGTASSLANIVADIEEISILADSVPIVELTPTQLDALNQFYGDPSVEDGILPIYFERPWMENLLAAVRSDQPAADQEEITALGTSDISQLELRVKVKSTANAGIDFTFYVDSEVAANGGRAPSGLIRKLVVNSVDVTGTGKLDFTKWPAGLGALAAVHSFEENSGDITSIEVHSGRGYTVQEQAALTEVLNNSLLKRSFRDYVPQTDVHHTLFMRKGLLRGLLPMTGNDLRFRYQMNAAVDFEQVLEFYGQLRPQAA